MQASDIVIHHIQMRLVSHGGFSFQQVALYDATDGAYWRDGLGCVRTWMSGGSASTYLRVSKETYDRPFVVKTLAGNVIYIRCERESVQ
jgi:hypothetical protein